MAKTFLVNLDLAQNQLLQPVIEVLASAPGSPVEGQIYYNSTDETLYVRQNAAWLDLGAGGATTLSDLSDVPTEPTGGAANYFLQWADTGDTFSWVDVSTLAGGFTDIDTDYGAETVTSAWTMNALTLGGDLQTGVFDLVSPDTTNYLALDDAEITLGTNSIERVSIDDSGLQLGGANARVTTILDEDNMASDSATALATQQSIKAYVDNAVTSGMTYQGGYNASTNTPDLDTAPSGISIGDTYTITAAGTFFTEDVQVGDMLIANQDNPTLLSHWTVVNKNIPDIVSASETAEGIIELATQAETDTGTDDLRAVTPLKLHTFLGTDDANLNSAVRYTEQIGNGASTTIVVTHNIGRQFLTAQVFETASPFAQVECDIEMDSTTATSFTFNTAPTSNEYTVVITG